MIRRDPNVAIAALISALVLTAVICLLPSTPVVDEWVHFGQAQQFARGNWQLDPELSTWPTVNLIVAAPLAIFGADSLTVARTTIAVFAVIAVVGFFLLAAHFDQPSAPIRTAQFFFLPIVLPFCGLVYTDIPALAAIIWMAWAAVRQRLPVFIVAALLAVAFRQNNIAWFVAGLALYAYEGRKNESSALHERLAPLVAVGIIVCVIWALIVWRIGGIALMPSAQEGHHLGIEGLPNIEFAIGLGGVLFAPILWSVRTHFLDLLRKPRWAMLLIAVFLLVATTFVVESPYNNAPVIIDGFLRNRILFQITHTPFLHWVFAAMVAIATFGFCLLPFCRDAGRFKVPLFAVGLAGLLPFAVIEQRYYLPLYTLFWAMRAPVDRNLERTQLLLNICLSVAVFVAIVGLGIFL